MADLPSGKTTLVYTGAAQEFTVAADTTLHFLMWGGAGSGCFYTSAKANNSTTSRGGAGGFVEGSVAVVAGDIVRIEVGQGGRRPTSGTTGGPGGWPDGGSAGTRIANAFVFGAGGGSTRLYVNGVLKAVAGGGAGAGSGLEGGSNTYHGGGAGNPSGANGGGNPGYAGAGGTQTEGGVMPYRPGDATSAGAYLKGGHGYPSGGSPSKADTYSGAGGGGGYYGGSGSGLSAGAGGGSSWLDIAGVAHPAPARGAGPLGTGLPDYVPGAAQPGVTETTVAATTNGGDGLVVLWDDNTGLAEGELPTVTLTPPVGKFTRPAHVTGAIGAVTVVPAQGGGSVGAFVSGPIGAVTATAPGAAAGSSVLAAGALPTVLVEARISASPAQPADVVVPIDVAVTTETPEAGAYGDHEIRPEPIDVRVLPVQGRVELLGGAVGILTSIQLVAPQGQAGSPADLAVELPELTTQPVEGYAGQAHEAALTSVVDLVPPEADAAGHAAASSSIATVAISPVQGSVQSGPAHAEGELDGLTVTPPRGYAYGNEAIVIPEQPDPISILPVEGQSHGDANVRVSLLSSLIVSRVNGYAHGSALVSPEPVTVYVQAPVGETNRGYQIARPLPTVFVLPVMGYAGDVPSIGGIAFGEPLPDLQVIAPEGFVEQHGHDLSVDLPHVTLTPPEAEATAAQSATAEGDMPVVLITPPEPALEMPAEATGDIGVIQVEHVEAEVTAEASARAPLAIVHVSPPEGRPPRSVHAQGRIPTILLTPPAQSRGLRSGRVILGKAVVRKTVHAEARVRRRIFGARQ